MTTAPLQSSSPPRPLRVEQNPDGCISRETSPGVFRREYPQRRGIRLSGLLLMGALVLSPRPRHGLGLLELGFAVFGGVWLLVASALAPDTAGIGGDVALLGVLALGWWMVASFWAWRHLTVSRRSQ
jgi:hypothetical protein